MFKNYIKTALRNISRNKANSILNIMGLAVGMAAFILILLYVQFELSFDRYHENARRIYRVVKEDPGNYYMGSNQYAVTPGPLASALIEEYPEVLSAARVENRGHPLISYGQKSFLETEIHFGDPQLLEIFSFDFMKGDPKTALEDPYSMVLSESAAAKYFGNEVAFSILFPT
ncbi:MAG: ABC transporter permease [Candidatus Aminicenantes bacterium]|nr:MAG: ABC transporter permease [Candidatus Aminicenantes bacterium]